MKHSGALILLLLAVSCGGRPSVQQPKTRDFPTVSVPSMYSQEEALEHAGVHFWDKYLDTTAIFGSDSTLLAGVPKEKMEEEMGIYSTLLSQMPRRAALSSVGRFASLVACYPDTAFFRGISDLTEKYLYDPQSPLRDEDLFGVYARRFSEGNPRYGRIAETSSLNAVGTKAADFSFTDLRGRSRTLYSINAERLVLIFGNPDCGACRSLMGSMASDGRISGMIASGELKIVDIYIDEDVQGWFERRAEYPSEWINGYAEGLRDDQIYHVRAIPSIYLLDADKTVLLKDAPEERLLRAL